MPEKKNITSLWPNKWFIAATFVLSLLPFSGTSTATATQGSQPTKTELVVSEKIVAKKASHIFSVSKRSHHHTSLSSLAVASRMSELVSGDVNVAIRVFRYSGFNDRLRCCHQQIIHLSSEDPLPFC